MRITAAMRRLRPNHPHIRKPRRPRKPRPISTGPKTGRPPRKLTTSEAAIRRFEALKRKRAGGNTGRKPWSTKGGPRADARPTGGGRRTSVTSRAAIGRSRLGRGGRVAGRPVRGPRRR